MDQCALCAQYKDELKKAEGQKNLQGRHWYAKKRNKINNRATIHKDIMHPNMEKLDQLIQTKQAEFNRLLRERNERNEKRERERRKAEKEEEEEKIQQERYKRRRF